MFQVRIAQLGQFRRLIQVIRELTHQISIQVSRRGFLINTADSMGIVQISVCLTPLYFQEFKSQDSSSISFSLNPFQQILKLLNPSDSLLLQYSGDCHVLSITADSRQMPKICQFHINLSYQIHQLFMNGNERYNCKILMRAKDINRLCMDLNAISQFIHLEVKKTHLKMTVECEEAGGWIDFKQKEGEDGVKIRTNREFDLKLSLNFLKKITKACALTEQLSLEIDNDLPTKFVYEFGQGKINYYLAPAIED